MGFFSWFSSTAKKSAAAAAIQGYFEIEQRHGIFPYDPAKVANKILTVACDAVPGLDTAGYRSYVLAAAALTVMLMEPDQSYDMQSHYGLALAAMIQALLVDPSFSPSPSEMKVMEGARVVLERHAVRPSEVKFNLAM